MRKTGSKNSTGNKWFDIAFKIVVVCLVIYLFIKVTTPIPQMSNEAKRKIDSLENSIKSLKIEQLRYDDVIHQQSVLVDSLSRDIQLAKERTTIIREYYHAASTKVDTYTPTQIDSFFKQRYSY
jgi:hypothetical protein